MEYSRVGIVLGAVRILKRRLCLGREMASVETLDNVTTGLNDASLGSSAGAEGQDEARVLIADHGACVIGCVVGSTADRSTSRAVDRDTCWVVGVVLHGRNDLHTASRERIAVDV